MIWPPRQLILAAGGVAALVLAAVASPSVLRRLEFFRVRQVELVGIRNLQPDALIAALGLPPASSVWDDLEPAAARVRALPGVADARLVRRLPGSLKLMVRETTPVALVPGARGLQVVDAAGRTLPFDPTRTGLDLPVAQVADSGLVGVLARVQATDPTLFREVTAARRVRADVVLELGARRLLLRRDAGPEVIQGVALVLQDLAARGRPYIELDGRFAGQVVVRRKATV